MQQLQLIDNGYQGADSLYLLLNHGGNPNLVVDGEHLLSEPYYVCCFWTISYCGIFGALVRRGIGFFAE